MPVFKDAGTDVSGGSSQVFCKNDIFIVFSGLFISERFQRIDAMITNFFIAVFANLAV
jgi:hypothetical protein